VNGLLRQGFRSAWGWPSVDGRGNSTAIDREALFQENAKACKKMPRLARKCQGLQENAKAGPACAAREKLHSSTALTDS
jgi:hypothetical protein